MEKNYNYDVIILGAGVSGLNAGLELFSNNINFIICEASSKILGRIQTLKDFSDFPIELGAEFIHGNYNEFYFIAKKFIKDHKYSFIKYDFNELYWVSSLQKLLEYNQIMKLEPKSIGKDLKNVINFEKIYRSYKENSDITIKDFREKYLKNNVFSLETASEKAANEEEIGILGIAEDEENWGNEKDQNYEEFLLKKGNFQEMFEIYFEKILDKVKLNSVVTKINYENDTIIISLQNNLQFTCKKIIITCSLGVLKSDLIEFHPKLPQEKLEAISGLGFSGGIKIIISFKKRFWKNNTFFIIANGEGLIPVYWVTSAGGRSNSFLLTGFLTGSIANNYIQKQKELLIEVKKQLNTLFDLKGNDLENNIEKVYVKNWSEEPFVRGAYSFIKTGNANKNLRKKLSDSVENKLFFAGEAVSINYSSTVQGGLDTGKNAARNIIDLLNCNK